MKLLRRLGVLAVIVATIVAIVVLTSHNSSNPAAGTQSDPHVGTSRYPAPTVANHTPPSATVAVANNPNAVPALANVNDKCLWAARGNNPPSLQDDGQGSQSYADMPSAVSDNTLRCAIARAKAAGYKVEINSVTCDEPVIQLLDESNNKLWSFKPFCMYIGRGGPLCKIPLVVTDYQGNFLRQSEPDLKRLQNFRADSVLNESAYADC